MGRLRRQWFAKRKNVIALLRETIFQQESPLVDTDASNKAADADAALQELGSDQVAFGYLTATVTVLDADPAVADEKLRMVERVIQGRGFVTIPETLNAVDAWLSSVPGNAYANVRQPIVSTLNLAHMMPMSAVWAGPEKNEHLDGPPLIVTRTDGATPFRLVTHIGDVGTPLSPGRPAWASRCCSPYWPCSSGATSARGSSPSTWGARCAPPSSALAVSTTTSVPMAASPSSHSRE